MKSWHFTGICGIGMSALAQFALAMQIKVSGSDRALDNPENASLKAMLQAQGVKLFAQDGSRFAPNESSVDAVIYSTAIEESNPDFANSQGVERIHRATALKMLIQERCASGKLSIAVAGSCGKTSTTAIIAEALCNSNIAAECVNGGMINAFANDIYPGNYHAGSGAIVFEADESDKSLLEFHPDYALVLNIGTDHYPKDELAEMFACFVNQAKKGAVLHCDVFELIKHRIKDSLTISTFGFEENADLQVIEYQCCDGVSRANFNNGLQVLPGPGRHTALNVAAAAALLEMIAIDRQSALQAALNTHGVARRFDFKGYTPNGAAVYDDYAHNPEKIANILIAAQELTGNSGRVWVMFQPHGYGPFGFMQQELGKNLHGILRKDDHFYLSEPYYAGGTSSFSPSASDVLAQWQSIYADLPVELTGSRESLSAILRKKARRGDVILIMGARDNTLALFASSLV